MKNFNVKKFIKATLILLPILLLVDIVYDMIFKELILKETFAMKNLFFKIAASLVGAYFFATSKTKEEN
ncbi:MAG TPA: hypothetical protein PLU36_07815 [Chitinophagaceae bacterium]|nr:hypothetical protein [Chitinophagaceae bacterium]MCC6635600.1 hypothetical protein [Chitinophagaceae bacterium]HMZ46693.1 hypothetical protein [Chitinophagaceae bacterium]HNE92955.1 hypothetical protein [Chitinophagaceae bacterium]HNF28754.1 hypothetical protein [Chitinophagaceae bacterium]